MAKLHARPSLQYRYEHYDPRLRYHLMPRTPLARGIRCPFTANVRKTRARTNRPNQVDQT
jgi:hypothetical protein